MKKIQLRLPESAVDALEEIGDGNISKGLRIVLARRQLPNAVSAGERIRIGVSLPDEAVEQLRAIGNGNINRGADIAVLQSPAVQKRISGE